MTRIHGGAPVLLGLGLLVAALLATAPLNPLQAAVSWRSGVRNNPATLPFASWRGTPLSVIVGWIEYRKGWSGMYAYASSSSPRQLHAKSPNVSFGHGLFPNGGNLAACARGDYDDEQREVARRLVANGVGDAEIRLGWEASGNWFAWTAVGKPADQWKTCFTRVARALKSVSPRFRIGWFMAKKGQIDVRTIYPADAPITNIGVSHYDDPEDRFGFETYKGGPWGLQAWLQFARSKGKKFAIGEWGVGRRGDNPQYIQDMHDFFKWAGDLIAHEAYFNTGRYQLYPIGPNPKSSQRYRELF